ncbi:hypothetical protein FRC03_009647 [Tulasnella sp. 419]|nr:hypothetical protein FRC03_009647 [Tulasnella sp. 419]
MSYADAWNLQRKGPVYSGPVTIVVDGLHEELVEIHEGMMLDDDCIEELTLDMSTVIQDIRFDRESWAGGERPTLEDAEEWKDALAMELDQPSELYGPESRLVVVDTNVLISLLPLCKSLVQIVNSSPALNITVIIPGIVIQELDGLKTSRKINIATRADGTQKHVEVSKLAREANNWLLQKMKEGCRCIRVQKETDTPRRPSWKVNRSGLTNDDLILECTKFFAAWYDITSANVMILTNDKNLALKALTEGIRVLSPGPGSKTEDLISEIYLHALPPNALIPNASTAKTAPPLSHGSWSTSSAQLDHGASGVIHIPSKNAQIDNKITGGTLSSSIDHRALEQEPPQRYATEATVPGDGAHPLSILQYQVFEYLKRVLPNVILENIQRAQNRQKSSEFSIWRNGRLEHIELPQGEEWRNWTLKECILWLGRVSPTTPTDRASYAASMNKLAEFVTPVGQKGGRRGELWGRGDWNGVVETLRGFCAAQDMDELSRAVEEAFVNGLRYQR